MPARDALRVAPPEEPPMFVTPDDIPRRELKQRLGAYDRDDVDNLITEITASFKKVWQERDALASRVAQLEQEVERYKENERVLGETLITSQRAAEQVKAHAQAQAQALLEQARARAEEADRRARREQQQIREETERLRSLERETRERCRALLTTALGAVGGESEPETREQPTELRERAATQAR